MREITAKHDWPFGLELYFQDCGADQSIAIVERVPRFWRCERRRIVRCAVGFSSSNWAAADRKQSLCSGDRLRGLGGYALRHQQPFVFSRNSSKTEPEKYAGLCIKGSWPAQWPWRNRLIARASPRKSVVSMFWIWEDPIRQQSGIVFGDLLAVIAQHCFVVPERDDVDRSAGRGAAQ